MDAIRTADTRPTRRAEGLTRRWPGLLLFVLGTFAVAAIGSAATVGGLDPWYAQLDKPPWTPPSWLFGPVWTALYLAMAVAAWRVWRAGGRGATAALVAYGVQLALNAAWSVLFFGLRSPGAALVDIVVLLGAIAVTMRLFARHDRPAVWLLAPYAGWVAFATALNAAIWARA